ncbi:hypothetical protein BN11_150006 [Nostocoides australiense Ben110]|uniref:Uncharacterized protein n=1 Tax=Nostocoides australiense Ben110 TaxID=1193182 RepID=W6JUN3_9MICO|nr:hypothetical protein BN11_150006 [Tetrasphaera australiensis Ben110]
MVRLSPFVVTVFAGNADVAGPDTTDPSLMEKTLL